MYYCQFCLFHASVLALNVDHQVIISFKFRNEERYDCFGEWIPSNLHAICYRSKKAASRESREWLISRTFTLCLSLFYLLLSPITLLIPWSLSLCQWPKKQVCGEKICAKRVPKQKIRKCEIFLPSMTIRPESLGIVTSMVQILSLILLEMVNAKTNERVRSFFLHHR